MKILKYLLLVVVAGVMFTACGSGDDASKVAEKIKSGQTLTQDDYKVLINYVGEFATKAQVYQNNIDNGVDAAKNQDELNTLKQGDEYLSLFEQTLKNATAEEVGADNIKLINSFTGDLWFDAPSWATVSTPAPEIGGIEMESPAADTSGVVAGAVDEMQVKTGI